MKTIKLIQNIMIIVGAITAISLVDKHEVSTSNKWAAFVIVGLLVLIIVEREIKSVSR